VKQPYIGGRGQRIHRGIEVGQLAQVAERDGDQLLQIVAGQRRLRLPHAEHHRLAELVVVVVGEAEADEVAVPVRQVARHPLGHPVLGDDVDEQAVGLQVVGGAAQEGALGPVAVRLVFAPGGPVVRRVQEEPGEGVVADARVLVRALEDLASPASLRSASPSPQQGSSRLTRSSGYSTKVRILSTTPSGVG